MQVQVVQVQVQTDEIVALKSLGTRARGWSAAEDRAEAASAIVSS